MTNTTVSASDTHAVMALANAALPDNDPRKITRADLARIQAEVLRADAEYDEALRIDPQDLEGFDRFNELRLIAVKIAALLPPE